jgi:hypothetical protein
VAILLMIIGGYFINGFYEYSIGGCWCLLMAIILVVIGRYFVSGYWWLLY